MMNVRFAVILLMLVYLSFTVGMTSGQEETWFYEHFHWLTILNLCLYACYDLNGQKRMWHHLPLFTLIPVTLYSMLYLLQIKTSVKEFDIYLVLHNSIWFALICSSAFQIAQNHLKHTALHYLASILLSLLLFLLIFYVGDQIQLDMLIPENLLEIILLVCTVALFGYLKTKTMSEGNNILAAFTYGAFMIFLSFLLIFP